MYIKLMKEMFSKMVVKKNPFLIPHYYHSKFRLYTNEQIMNYREFLESHQKIYATSIEYKVEYDEETLLEQGEKVAGRIWITTKKSEEVAKKIEVMLIAQFKEKKFYRIWELTYPDWSQLPAFKQI